MYILSIYTNYLYYRYKTSIYVVIQIIVKAIILLCS